MGVGEVVVGLCSGVVEAGVVLPGVGVAVGSELGARYGVANEVAAGVMLIDAVTLAASVDVGASGAPEHAAN